MDEAIQDMISQGIELMAAQRYEEAIVVFESVVKADRGNYEGYYNLGNAYINLERFDEGIAAFKKSLIAQPDSDEATYSLACAYFLADKHADAVREFNRCEERDYIPDGMYQILEIIFSEAEDYTQAIRYANKAIQLQPLDPQHYVNKAQFYLLQGKTKEALSCLHDVEELLPDAGEPYEIEAQLFAHTEEYDRALEVADRALSRFPEDPSMLLLKGDVLNTAERYGEAEEVLLKAKSLAQNDELIMGDVLLQLAIAQAGAKDVDDSIASLEQAVDSNKAGDEALLMLISECAAVERFEDAERYADAVLSGEHECGARTKATAVFWKATAMKKLGREEEAKKAFAEAVGTLRRITIANPGMLEVYAYRLQCHKELGEYDKALELADHIVHLAPEDATGYAFRYDVLEAMGNKAEAETMRAKALSLNPKFEF